MKPENADEFVTDPMYREFRDYCKCVRYEAAKLNLDPSLVCNGVAWNFNKAVVEAVKEARTCRECGGTDLVCLKGHEDSMKEIRERERKAVAERDARIAELEKALEPFTHPDLSEVLSGNCKGDDSPVFQRNKAMLLIGHFRKARKALGKGE